MIANILDPFEPTHPEEFIRDEPEAQSTTQTKIDELMVAWFVIFTKR